jgi:methylmalonyl-CoA mutase cobalamin-binding domain/chain
MASTLELAKALADLEEEKVYALVRDGLRTGQDTTRMLDQLKDGLRTVGLRYEEKTYFLAELAYSGTIFKTAFQLIAPRLQQASTETLCRVVIGTVEGDVHDLGKDIVVTMLECNGFEVHDLGVDVPPERFLEKAKEVNASIVGLSALLSAALSSLQRTIDAFTASGRRDQVKIIIGGGIVDDRVMREVGADAYATDAATAVARMKALIEANPP